MLLAEELKTAERRGRDHPRRLAMEASGQHEGEVGAFYWTDWAPDIVNSGREEQGSISV